MKTSCILALLFLAVNAFGQPPVTEPNESLNTDPPKVVYVDKQDPAPTYAFFLDNMLMNRSLLETLDPALIDSMNVVKDSIQIDNIQYYGQIHIKTKNGYSPKTISLADLKSKYTDLGNQATIFMIDETVLNTDYDTYLIDENYLLTIIVDKVKNTKNNIDLNIIKLVCKTAENIKKSKEIRIRGGEITMNR